MAVSGVVLKVQGRFVCWDSYSAGWYLGPRRLSEIFPWHLSFQPPSKQLSEALALYPSASVVYEVDRS